MVNIIEAKLKELEHEHNVTILYACESGSRAWGFASTDSDYDVRFIYAQSLENYLSISERRDVIEVPVNEVLDISGWDIRKALQLFLKSNAPLYEWLQSPVIYQKDPHFVETLTALIDQYFSLRAGSHHYVSMAGNIFDTDLQSETVKLKKYFYALRPALAALWIVERKVVPPMEFHLLRAIIKDEQWQYAVDALLEMKKAAEEKVMIKPVKCLHQWLESTLTEVQEKAAALPVIKHTTAALDNIFRKYIRLYDI